MYIPHSFAERDAAVMCDFIEAHPFGALVTCEAPSGLFATHLPFVLDRSSDANGTLRGHVARANPHAKLGSGQVPALVIFSGPEAYITPAWYATKRDTGKAVPTWNYAVVHAYGTLRLREDESFLRAHLDELTHQHESGLHALHGTPDAAWQVSDAPADFITQQLKAIVGIEIAIDRLEGKFKMSQNRPAADISGVIGGLGASPHVADHAVAAMVQQRRPRETA